MTLRGSLELCRLSFATFVSQSRETESHTEVCIRSSSSYSLTSNTSMQQASQYVGHSPLSAPPASYSRCSRRVSETPQWRHAGKRSSAPAVASVYEIASSVRASCLGFNMSILYTRRERFALSRSTMTSAASHRYHCHIDDRDHDSHDDNH